ncbi:hypothetical protein QY95_01928 [Bacillus thermotolerans]|uniref:Uncharacterized protein n=1 Tax=Bacillus thermotolerans TaxID=1221996 RepID=A0A0F5I3G7_BACTR|nr:hypothetical protein QY95_01928 [Bacillus thermotolerans]
MALYDRSAFQSQIEACCLICSPYLFFITFTVYGLRRNQRRQKQTAASNGPLFAFVFFIPIQLWQAA